MVLREQVLQMKLGILARVLWLSLAISGIAGCRMTASHNDPCNLMRQTQLSLQDAIFNVAPESRAGVIRSSEHDFIDLAFWMQAANSSDSVTSYAAESRIRFMRIYYSVLRGEAYRLTVLQCESGDAEHLRAVLVDRLRLSARAYPVCGAYTSEEANAFVEYVARIAPYLAQTDLQAVLSDRLKTLSGLECLALAVPLAHSGDDVALQELGQAESQISRNLMLLYDITYKACIAAKTPRAQNKAPEAPGSRDRPYQKHTAPSANEKSKRN